jgi:TetR/AcrR family transcriptional regulator, tetracycline repressor protein
MPLSRDEVLHGALQVLQEVGLDRLTMRRLADALDVQAGAIYWHFANKQELVDAMVDEMMGGLLEPPLAGSWDAQLAELCRRLARGLLSRRDSARLATSAFKPGPNGLAVSEAMLRIARGAKLPNEATLWATAALGYYVLGYATDVQATEAAKARGLTSVLKSFKKQIDPRRHPELTALAQSGVKHFFTGGSFRDRFEFGLRVILDGLKTQSRSTGKTRSGGKALRRRTRPPAR